MRFAPWLAAALASNCFALAACGDDGSSSQLGSFGVDDVTVSTAEDTPISVSIPVHGVGTSAVTVTIAMQPMHGTVTASQGDTTTYSYAPAANYDGSDTFTATVSDGTNTATGTVNITVTPVDDAPTAGSAMFSTPIGETLTIPTAMLLADVTDIDSTTLTIVSVQGALNGDAALNGDNVTFTPDPGYAGITTFSYTVSDGMLSSDGVVQVNVGGDNRPPVAVADSETTTENTPLVLMAAQLLANDTDPDGDTLSIASVSNAVNGAAAFDSSTSTITFTPNTNFHGNGSFDYQVSDGNGGHDTATVTVAVLHVNQNPVANPDSLTTAENTAGTVNLLGNDTDADGDTITVTSVTQGAHGAVAFTGGVATYTPATNFTGLDSFTYAIADGNGGTASGTVTVNVQGVNHPPVANPDSMTVPENSSASLDVALNDTDIDGDTLHVTGNTTPANGVVSFTGTVATYTANSNFVGTDSFTYTISDGRGGTASAKVTVNVTAVNRPPVATNDLMTAPENGTGTANVLANDSDPDHDTLSVSNFTQPGHGAVTFAGGVATYTPAHDFSGNDAFTYTVSDGKGGSATGVVSVTVSHVNQPPVAANDTLATTENTTGSVNVASNDTDPDNDTLSISAFTQPAHGSVAFSNTTANYSPAPNFFGTDSFTYTISDGHGATATASVAVTVAQGTGTGNHPPVGVADALSGPENALITGNVLANDTDADGDPLTAILVGSGPANASSFNLASNGAVTYQSAGTFHGTDTFTYKPNDGHADGNVVTVTITVTPVNHAPVAANATDYILAGATGNVTIPLIASDIDGDPLTFHGQTSTDGGGSVSFGNGVATYKPQAEGGFPAGGDSFTFFVNDGTVNSNTATITLAVPACGDGAVNQLTDGTGFEECDDGNTVSGDGCEANCTFTCGDGVNGTPSSAAVDRVTGSCFAVYAQSATYEAAQAECVAGGGHLATIEDQTEQNAVVSSFGGAGWTPWIGVNDLTSQGDHWVTGEPLAFAPFDNSAGECVMIDSSTNWSASNDCGNASGAASGVLCEFDLFPRQDTFATPTTATSVVSADFNDDGIADVAFLNPTTNQVGVMLADGLGGFGPATLTGLDATPNALAAGDIDGDHRADVVIAFTGGSQIEALHGNGDGSLGAAQTFGVSGQDDAEPVAIVLVDLNGDNKLDVAVANSNAFSVGILNGTGTGNFTGLREIGLGDDRPNSIAAGKVTTGGAIGLATADGAEGQVSILTPSVTGVGNFDVSTYGVDGSPSAVAIGDFVNSGHPNVAVGFSDDTQLQLIDGTGGFDGENGSRTAQIGVTVSALGQFTDSDDEELLVFGSPDGHTISVLPPTGFQGEGGISVSLGTASHVTSFALGDFDHDGVIDVALAGDNQSGVTELTGHELGGFGPAFTQQLLQRADGILPLGILAADLHDIGGVDKNNIAEPDVVVVDNGDSSISVLANAAGTLGAPQQIFVGNSPVAVASGDLDGDGVADLVVTDGAEGTVTVLLSNGSVGGFTFAGTFDGGESPAGVVLADFDGDGNLDAAIGQSTGDTIVILHGNGDGGFDGAEGNSNPFAGDLPMQLAAGDLDGDGLADLVVASPGDGNVHVLLNQSSNDTFEFNEDGVPPPLTAVASPQFVALGNLNGDTNANGQPILDLVTVDHDANLILVRMGNGAGGFSASTAIPVGISPTSAVIADLDGDGLFDIAVANNKSSNITYVLNQGGGTFGPPITMALGAGAFGIVAADFDLNGHIDLGVSDGAANDVEILKSPR